VGGDRFAGNLVCLPGGHYFGRVGPAEAARVVDLHLQGTIDLDHYRGCCVDPPVVQAAEWFARHRTGLAGVDDLVLDGRRPPRGRADAVRFRLPTAPACGGAAGHPGRRPPAADLPQHPAGAAAELSAGRAGRRPGPG
jgi:(2Fe-2S) ferredoxin